MKNKIVDVKNLTKKYENKDSFALDHINLKIEQGSIFGLLGPNGAGKSSFINIISGLSNKTSGKVLVCGVDLDIDPKTIKGNIGVVPQEINIDPFFFSFRNNEYPIWYVWGKEKDNNNLEILKKLDLYDKANSYSRSLSGGMKRRLMVAKAMVHNPPLLILDEPTAGVDVELRKNLWNYIKSLNKLGVTIILTTHYLKEAEILCDQIAVINKGKVIACDTKKNLLKLIDEKELTIEFSETIKSIPQKLRKLCISKEPKKIVLKFKKSEISTADIIKVFVEKKYNLRDISTKDSDLEDIFIKLLKD